MGVKCRDKIKRGLPVCDGDVGCRVGKRGWDWWGKGFGVEGMLVGRGGEEVEIG